MVFHWILSDSKSPQVSRTLLSILADLSKVVVWIVSNRPLIYKSSCPFKNPSVIVPRAPITSSIIVTFTFHSFFSSLARSWYLSFFSLSFNFSLWSAGTEKSTILQILFFFFFFFFWLLQVLAVWMRLGDPVICQNPIGVWGSHSPGPILGCANTICSYGQIQISCTFPSESPCPPNRV